MGEVSTVRAAMPVSHHQFWLVDDDRLPRPSGAPGNGLVLPGAPGTAVIYTGIHTGVVGLTVDARDAAPAEVELDGWDEVVEVSLTVPAGRLRAVPPMADGPPLPPLTAVAGDHRLRVHARGRDTAVDGVTREPEEEYLIVAWPAPAAPERVYLVSDEYGASLRRAAGATPADPAARRPATRADDPNRSALDARLRRARGDR
jgi:hypothetical protein